MTKDKWLTPLKAIRKYCVDCAGNQKAPKSCTDTICPLYAFRMGTNPRCGGRGDARHFARAVCRNQAKPGSLGAITDGGVLRADQEYVLVTRERYDAMTGSKKTK